VGVLGFAEVLVVEVPPAEIEGHHPHHQDTFRQVGVSFCESLRDRLPGATLIPRRSGLIRTTTTTGTLAAETGSTEALGNSSSQKTELPIPDFHAPKMHIDQGIIEQSPRHAGREWFLRRKTSIFHIPSKIQFENDL
jgi:hypothetical protein